MQAYGGVRPAIAGVEKRGFGSWGLYGPPHRPHPGEADDNGNALNGLLGPRPANTVTKFWSGPIGLPPRNLHRKIGHGFAKR
jgi:hypothetical protein